MSGENPSTPQSHDPLLMEIQAAAGSDFVLDLQAAQEELEESHALFSHLPIKVLSILGGLLGTITFLAFLGLSGIWKSQFSMGFLGVLFIAAVVAFSRAAKNILLDTSMITLYVAGCALLAVSFESLGFNDKGNADLRLIVMMAVGALTVAFGEGFMLQLFAVLIFNGSLFCFIPEHHAYGGLFLPVIVIGIALLLLIASEAKILSSDPKINHAYKAVQTGFFLSYAGGLLATACDGHFDLYYGNMWMVSLFHLSAILILAYGLTQRFDVPMERFAIIALACVIFVAATFFAPYVSGGLLLLMLSFHYGRRTQTGISIVLLIYFVGQYYYDLRCTLLVKSGILFLSGILLMGVWLIFQSQLKAHEEV